MSIYTIGYEGLDMDGFLTLLRNSNVETVVDIRELPLSRKPGFSKKSLSDTLNLNGFEYLHVPELGCPKPIRDQYRMDASWTRYTTGFLRYLDQQDEVIAELAAMAATTTCALLCFEADYRFCHRSMVADALGSVSGMPIGHLRAAAIKKGAPETRPLAFA
ncbi:MAG: hypothetical protein CTY39_01435 [Hyphomicrobium sp.]|nr:MAG: hypothetical protein CTY39_01435 [Hyphomicrobium sp.]